MNTDKNICEIRHKLTDHNIIKVECNRETKTVNIEQTLCDDCEPYDCSSNYIELTMHQAYKLIDLIKTAMEVKI